MPRRYIRKDKEFPFDKETRGKSYFHKEKGRNPPKAQRRGREWQVTLFGLLCSVPTKKPVDKAQSMFDIQGPV
jgi:hypothetical protein